MSPMLASGGTKRTRRITECPIFTISVPVITVSLVGACGTCPASTDTLKAGIERIMKDRVDGIREVVAV